MSFAMKTKEKLEVREKELNKEIKDFKNYIDEKKKKLEDE